MTGYATLAAKSGDRHPRYLRPRVEAEDVYVLSVSHVAWVGYDATLGKVAATSSRTGFKAVAALLAAYAETPAADGRRPARARAWADASTAVAACLESAG